MRSSADTKQRRTSSRNDGTAHTFRLATLLNTVEGGACTWHNNTWPRPWRGRAQIFEDAQHGQRVEVKRQRVEAACQVDTPEQLMNDKPWLKSSVARVGGSASSHDGRGVTKAGCSYKASTGVGAAGFRPSVPLDLGSKNCLTLRIFQTKDWLPSCLACSMVGKVESTSVSRMIDRNKVR